MSYLGYILLGTGVDDGNKHPRSVHMFVINTFVVKLLHTLSTSQEAELLKGIAYFSPCAF